MGGGRLYHRWEEPRADLTRIKNQARARGDHDQVSMTVETGAKNAGQPARSGAPAAEGKRRRRERQTIAAMIRVYCRGRHAGGKDLCPECRGLLEYAMTRLTRCRFGADKPTCAQCPVHCYQPRQREQIRVVMRYAGPRMLWRHPLLSLGHLLDGRRPV
jgi:hypothetical protein